MSRPVEPRFRSLSVRLLVPLLATVGLVLAADAVVGYRSTRQHVTELVGAEADRCAGIILRATHERMLEGRRQEVQRTIDELAEGESVVAIRLYDVGGRVIHSAQLAEVGGVVGRDAAPCSSCHRPGLPAARRAATHDSIVEGEGEAPRLRHLAVIRNGATCAASACHASPATEPVLGVLDVELSMSPLRGALATLRRQAVWTMLALLLFTGSVSTGIIYRLVHRPVKQLYEGMQRVARGDLDARLVVEGEHELGQLAASFNAMSRELGEARREVTDWSRRLEEQVVAKGDELRRAQRQVLHMERMASLGKLAATVAHELNNPISGILACARLVERTLAETDLPEETAAEVRQDLRLIADECTRCGTIVKNLLLFARQTGGAPMADVDVTQVVERSLLLVRHHLEMSGVELDRHVSIGDPMLVADGGQLEQALVALLVNAVEAMRAAGEGGLLTVRLAGDEDEVAIDVGDTGVGIHPEVLPHIFEPFFSTKHQESGVGLGLAVVYGIVQRHGGAIDVDSEPGRGTTFHLRLPRRPAAPPQAAVPAAERRGGRPR